MAPAVLEVMLGANANNDIPEEVTDRIQQQMAEGEDAARENKEREAKTLAEAQRVKAAAKEREKAAAMKKAFEKKTAGAEAEDVDDAQADAKMSLWWLCGALLVSILLSPALQMLSAPAAKYLIISSNETVASSFQLEMASMLDVSVDVLCANKHAGLLFDTFIFNCAPESSAIARKTYIPLWRMRSRLPAYEAVYLVESGAPHRLDRSPFHDKPVYDHVRSQLSSDRGTHVTVVFTDITCEGMSKYMHTSSKQEEDCRSSPAGRRESFKRFYERVGGLQGDLDLNYSYVDAEADLSVTGQVTRALDTSPRTSPHARGAGRGEPSAPAGRGEPRLATAADFTDQLNKLRQKLREPPAALFEAPKDELVRKHFPRFQVGVVGLGGAGKSTTLRWLSYYAGVTSTWRTGFGVDTNGGVSFTRKLTERGMAKENQDAQFAVFDTMGLERESMTKVVEHDLAWLVDGRVRKTCEMEWLGHTGYWWGGGCSQPWKEPPEQHRALHALLFVTRFYPTDSDDFREAKNFVKELRRMLHAKQKELVVAVTHLDGCDETQTAEACMREYERLLGVGVGNIVVLGATRRVPAYAMKAWPGLDGSIIDEQDATDGVYLEPDALGQLTTKLQMACRKGYEQQLNFDDEVAASASASTPSFWSFYYFGILATAALCCAHWRHTNIARKATLPLAAWVFIDVRYVSHSLLSLLLVLCPWSLVLLFEMKQEMKLLLERLRETEAATQSADQEKKHWLLRFWKEKQKLKKERTAREEAEKTFKKAQRDALKASGIGNGLWNKLVDGLTDDQKVRKFFEQRQIATKGASSAKLQIESAVRVVNDDALKSFLSTSSFDIDPLKAHPKKCDTLLFHGTSEEAVPSIQADGRPLMKYSKSGMLGKGIYGAPDPRKSAQFCQHAKNGKFMFICRYNLSNAMHAGPSTSHKNPVFDEFCVYKDNKVVLLWILKLKP